MKLHGKERDVTDWLSTRRASMYETLEYHVSIPTGKDYIKGLDLYRLDLTERLKALGATIERRDGAPRPGWMRQPGQSDESQRPHPILIARHVADPASPHILIAGHIDTVHAPEGDFKELTADADGVNATGPGAVDMKGGIVVALEALRALHEAGVQVNWTFLLNADEETGSFQSEAVLRDEAAKANFGIAIEPALADGSLAIERMGSGQFMIEVHGVSAHVGREFEKGRSAVTKLAEVLLMLARMADPDAGMIVNVGPLQGGPVTNAVPDYAACWGNVRYRDPAAGEDLGRMIDALADDDNANDTQVIVHRHWNRPAKPLTPAVEKFADLAQRTAEDLGQSLPFARTGGVCDGNILQDAGLPTLDTLGVRGGNLHRTDEFVEIASLVERSQLLALILMRLNATQ